MTDLLGNDIIYNTEIVNHLNGILVTNGFIHQPVVEKYKMFLPPHPANNSPNSLK